MGPQIQDRLSIEGYGWDGEDAESVGGTGTASKGQEVDEPGEVTRNYVDLGSKRESIDEYGWDGEDGQGRGGSVGKAMDNCGANQKGGSHDEIGTDCRGAKRGSQEEVRTDGQAEGGGNSRGKGRAESTGEGSGHSRDGRRRKRKGAGKQKRAREAGINPDPEKDGVQVTGEQNKIRQKAGEGREEEVVEGDRVTGQEGRALGGFVEESEAAEGGKMGGGSKEGEDQRTGRQMTRPEQEAVSTEVQKLEEGSDVSFSAGKKSSRGVEERKGGEDRLGSQGVHVFGRLDPLDVEQQNGERPMPALKRKGLSSGVGGGEGKAGTVSSARGEGMLDAGKVGHEEEEGRGQAKTGNNGRNRRAGGQT